jgi:hypothetical protein
VIVGTDVHTYDAFPRPYQSPIPPMRTPQESVGGSCTPIYDALYSEYRRLFRALPGDRTGEEHLQFPAMTRGWQPSHGYGNGRHRDQLPAALPPGPTAGGPHDNRMHGM